MRNVAATWGGMVAAVVLLLAGLRWLAPAPFSVVSREPDMDGAPVGGPGDTAVVNIGLHFQPFDGKAGRSPGAWPRFRGAAYDNIAHDAPPLADVWPADGPPVLWSVELGEGHAAPAVQDGRVYLLDYDEEKRQDALRCFSLDDGREIWRRSYDVRIKRNHGRSRTVPAVSNNYCVTIGPSCHAMCVRADTGNIVWGLDMVAEYGTEVPGWYTGQCPLIDGDEVVLAPVGAQVLLIGVDCESGDVRWMTPNNACRHMSHSSVTPAVIGGKRMYIYSAIGGMVGVSAEMADRGRILWETTEWSHSVIVPCPVVFEDGRVYVTAGYGAGGALFQVTREGDGFAVKRLWADIPKQVFASEQHTPILSGNRLYGVLPKDAGEYRQQFVCFDPTTRTYAWTSGQKQQFGLGPFLLADGKFYVLDDKGRLAMFRLLDDGACSFLAEADLLDGHDSWGPIALAGTRMFLRDSRRMICVDVGAR